MKGWTVFVAVGLMLYLIALMFVKDRPYISVLLGFIGGAIIMFGKPSNR